MACDEGLAARVRDLIGARPEVTEREMFGGIAFMISGNMAVGVTGDDLMVRVGKEADSDAVERAGARAFDMGARSMVGWIRVTEEGFGSDQGLTDWVAWGTGYAESLPPK